MEELNIKSYGKINLILDVTGKRPNGYHEVITIFQKIDLFDGITLVKQKEGISVTCNNPKVPTDEKNIAYKAAMKVIEKYKVSGGVRININKKIPVASGLGGESSNAASTLMGLNKLFNLSIPHEEMLEIATSLGADVPFFLQDRPCLASGIGEKLEPFKNGPKFDLIIVVPKITFPKNFEKTKWAYQMIDGETIIHPNNEKMIKCFERGDWKCVIQNLANVFEPILFKKFPIIKTVKEKLIKYGCANALMVGAGVGVYGIADENDCQKMSKDMEKYGNLIITKTI